MGSVFYLGLIKIIGYFVMLRLGTLSRSATKQQEGSGSIQCLLHVTLCMYYKSPIT